MIARIDEKSILPVAPSAAVPAPAAGANGAVNINCCKKIIYGDISCAMLKIVLNYV